MKISEIFYSIQGESTAAGLPTVFIRCSGCNCGCVYCDTEYAKDEGDERTVAQVLSAVRSWTCRRITVTGGEPLLQEEMAELCERLVSAGYDVQVETNGVEDISILPEGVRVIMDVKTPDSVAAAAFTAANLEHLTPGDEIKFVICSQADFEWSLDFLAEHNCDGAAIIFSAAAGYVSHGELAEWLLASDRSDIRLQVQLHRVIWPDAEKGR